MKKSEFETLIKLMIKHKEALRLGTIVYETVIGNFKLYEVDSTNK